MADARSQTTERRRFASTRTHGNMFGYRGVEWRQTKGKFAARIEPATGQRGKWLGHFATAVDAAHAYDEAARAVYGAAAFLNFPGPGERATQQSRNRENFCPEGHDLIEYGAIDSRGRLKCKMCNLAAVKRYRSKKAESVHA